MIIHINNGKCKIETVLKYNKILRNKFRLRVPGAFYSDAYRRRVWDGFQYYITEAGYFSTGLLPDILDFIKENKWDYKLIDNRKLLLPKKTINKVGNLTLRDYQKDSVISVVTNKYDNLYFPRGILDEATNSGKNLIAAALFKSYDKSVKLIFLINRIHIYEQAKEEIGKLLPDEIGYIGSKGELKWGRFMICMTDTISQNLPKFKNKLKEFDIALVDECHYASSATYKEILILLEEASIKVGLSGTPFKHKDKNKNQRILSFFGRTLHKTTNEFLIKEGFSTKPIVTIVKGNTKIKCPKDYQAELNQGLIFSKERNRRVVKRCSHHVKRKRLPLMVVAKFHNHTELLYKIILKKFPELKVKFIHVGVKDRLAIIKQFKKGKIDILVTSKIIKEGQNLPLIQSSVLACGGDSVIDVLQIIGRMLRKHKSKKRVYIDDFMDEGSYLKRHSKHRVKVYKSEKFKIIDKSK